jgi:zinc/manganese transport system substrate-binding protein
MPFVRLIRVTAAALLAVVLFVPFRASADTFKIVTTTTDLAAIARAVGGEMVSVESICTGREDPHFLQARPGYILKARDADLWIRVGRELEIGWEGPILEGSRNSRIRVGGPGHLDASRDALVLDLPSERVTRAMGDVHPSGNPHYWLDPWNGRAVAGTICEKLSVLMPDKAPEFAANLERFRKEIDERMFGSDLVGALGGDALWKLQRSGGIDRYLEENGMTGRLGGWSARMRPFRGAGIVTYHRSWVYFAERFGLEVVAELEPKPGIPPTAGHLAEVVERMKGEGARLILQETYYSAKAARSIAEKTGAEVVITANSVGGDPKAADYLSLMDLIVERVSGALAKDARGSGS